MWTYVKSYYDRPSSIGLKALIVYSVDTERYHKYWGIAIIKKELNPDFCVTDKKLQKCVAFQMSLKKLQ